VVTFEDILPVGKEFISPGRTMGEGDLSLLTGLTWIIGEIHSNLEYMKDTAFGERIFPAPCILACAVGLAGISGLVEALNCDQLRTVGLLGFNDVRFTSPVKPGDTLTVHSQIIEVRRTSKNKNRGVVVISYSVYNQRRESVMNALQSTLIELIS